jgi:hypothetical protein
VSTARALIELSRCNLHSTTKIEQSMVDNMLHTCSQVQQELGLASVHVLQLAGRLNA